MLILPHLIALLASVVLPLLVALQKGRNGDFDYIYQRTIDYTSSFQVPNVFGFLTPSPMQKVAVPVMPFVNVTNATILLPVTGQNDTQLGEQPAYLNVTAEPNYTSPPSQSVLHRFWQATFPVVDAWLGISKHVLSILNSLIRTMDELKDFSAELHLGNHDFSHASMSRTRRVLLIAVRSLLWSLGRIVFPLSLVVGMLVQLFAVVLFVVSIGLAYYVYTLFQALAKEKEGLKQEQASFQQLVAQAETVQKALDTRVMQLEEKEKALEIRETEGTKLQAQADTLRKHLDQRTTQLFKSQEDLAIRESTVMQLRLHTDSLQQQLNQKAKLLADRQESLEQQETAAKEIKAHAATLQHDLEQQKQLLQDQREDIENFQACSKRQLRDAHAKIASLEGEMDAQLQRHAEGQESALKQAQEENQRLRAANKALDDALLTEKKLSHKTLDQIRNLRAKQTDESRRLNAVNIMYESQKKALGQKTAQIEELSSERDSLAQQAKAAEAAAQKLRESLEKREIDFTNEVSAATSLEQQLQETRSQLHQGAAELEMSQSKNAGLSQKLMEADSRSQSFENEVKRLENDLSRKLSAVETSEQQAEQLRNASEENALIVASLRDELAALQHEHTDARAKEGSLRDRAEALEDDVETKTSTIEELETQAERDQRALGQNNAELARAEARVVTLRQDNEMSRARAEGLQERVSRLEHELDIKTSSVQAYERNSEHQERVLERRNAELAQTLQQVKTLEGQLETFRTDVGNSAREPHTETVQPAVPGIGEDNSGVEAAPEATRFAHQADPAHAGPPENPARQEVAEPTDEQDQAPVRKRGHRARRKRAGKQQAAKRQRIPRRHSFDSHAHKACLRCGGPLPVKVWCIPKELRQAGGEEPTESEMPVRTRRHSLYSLAHRRCPVCGGPLQVEVDFVPRVCSKQEDDEGAGGSSTGEVARPRSGQTPVSRNQNSSPAARATTPGPTGHAAARSTGPTPSHTPLHDGASEVDGVRDQTTGQSADTPRAQPRRRRRYRAKGRKVANEQETTEAQDAAQSPAPSMLSSRWGPEASPPPRRDLPPPGPATLFSRWTSEESTSAQDNLPPRPPFSPQQPAPFTPSPSNVFPPYRPPGQNNGIGYNFGQPSRHPFSPSSTGFSPSPSGFAPSYNAGPTWAPGQRPPPFALPTTPLFPQSHFPFSAADRGQPLYRPNQLLNPGVSDFRPSQPFPPRDSNVSKWAD